ncbi:succinate dehydrogenase cytochrome b subunit [Flavobacterium agricola]|uniref:Succinate dehydrogenase cytochrome b subunit n=1 Tax=Flavobacterium agricola TaxID=2870839 RepID=A0ABY6LZH8_9FLAO|nr:succinate dehydrogenase cytochrome b subunit [Flavobacterium agricola]UYW00855.1 succinate dehydrogenase cytochrome b subunit [Flavobacterium agricola]
MAKSALLKSSIAKKWWMSLTGLFLCVFLVGHLVGNLQLIFGTSLQFNEYALFMTTNPAVKILSYVTYFSILFHAIDGILLTIQNKKARPIGYAVKNDKTNSSWASRNMAVLGTLLLVFIVTHMVNFWAKMHFSEMPLQQQLVVVANPMTGIEEEVAVYNFTDGSAAPVSAVQMGQLEIKNGREFYQAGTDLKVKEGYKDLYKITVDFFKNEQFGLIAVIGYVIAMIVLGFHLSHGFASAFQSLGVNNPKYNGFIKAVGLWFSILVPALFAIIPLYIYFVK